MMATIAQMTRSELQQMIDERIDERLAFLLGAFEVDEDAIAADELPDSRTWQQVKHDIERDRWTPPPGAKSSLELLREDRER